MRNIEFKGLKTGLARHLLKESALAESLNVEFNESSIRKRSGFSLTDLRYSGSHIFPDSLGQLIPGSLHRRNFALGKILLPDPDLGEWPDFPGFASSESKYAPSSPKKKPLPGNRWKYIVKALFQRKTILGWPDDFFSSLNQDLKDNEVKSTDVNTARQIIQAYCPRFMFPPPYNVTETRSIPFIFSKESLLNFVGIGGDTPRKWSNQRADGSVYYADTMGAEDISSSLVFRELEHAIKALIRTRNLFEFFYPETFTYDDGLRDSAQEAFNSMGYYSSYGMLSSAVSFMCAAAYINGKYSCTLHTSRVLNPKYDWLYSGVTGLPDVPKQVRLYMMLTDTFLYDYGYPFFDLNTGLQKNQAHLLAEYNTSDVAIPYVMTKYDFTWNKLHNSDYSSYQVGLYSFASTLINFSFDSYLGS